MAKFFRLIIGFFLILFVTACNKQESANQQAIESNQDKALSGTETENTTDKSLTELAFKSTEWTELMPADDLEVLMNPPSYIDDIEDGSMEDQISSQIQNTLMAASDDRYQQALTSKRVIPEMDGQAISIPGFIVPLSYSGYQTISQFFLVPFFGACIHVPPPPPNQIIFVDYPEGLKNIEIYQPYTISGVLKTELIENDMATAAYTMKMHTFEEYIEEY